MIEAACFAVHCDSADCLDVLNARFHARVLNNLALCKLIFFFLLLSCLVMVGLCLASVYTYKTARSNSMSFSGFSVSKQGKKLQIGLVSELSSSKTDRFSIL